MKYVVGIVGFLIVASVIGFALIMWLSNQTS